MDVDDVEAGDEALVRRRAVPAAEAHIIGEAWNFSQNLKKF